MSPEPGRYVAPAPAIDVGWTDLLARTDVIEECSLNSPVGVLAFHGGLEVGTLEIARSVAATAGASLYTVDQPEGLRWHVPSASVDPGEAPALRRFLDHVEITVALHGYGRSTHPWGVLLGGTNRRLAALISAEMAARPPLVGIDRMADIPVRLRGLHPANPVNRAPSGGVQVELPVRARFPAALDQVAEALVAAIRRWELTAGQAPPAK